MEENLNNVEDIQETTEVAASEKKSNLGFKIATGAVILATGAAVLGRKKIKAAATKKFEKKMTKKGYIFCKQEDAEVEDAEVEEAEVED